MWKFHNFSINQILREINFGDCRSTKYAISTHLEVLNLAFLWNFALLEGWILTYLQLNAFCFTNSKFYHSASSNPHYPISHMLLIITMVPIILTVVIVAPRKIILNMIDLIIVFEDVLKSESIESLDVSYYAYLSWCVEDYCQCLGNQC